MKILKKPMALLLTAIMLVSAVLCGAPLTFNLQTKAASTFVAQHIDVDFNNAVNYPLGEMTPNNNFKADNTVTPAYMLWSIKSKQTDSNDKYLSFDNDGSHKISKKYAISFMPNADSDYNGSSEMQLQSNSTYRISFDYKLNTAKTNFDLCLYTFDSTKNANTTNANQEFLDVTSVSGDSVRLQSYTSVNGKRALRLTSRDDNKWCHVTATFTVPDLSTNKRCLNIYMGNAGVTNPNTDTENYHFGIDNIQIDRLTKLNVVTEAGTTSVDIAPSCAYNQYLFSDTEAFAGDDLPYVADGSSETYSTTGSTGTVAMNKSYSDPQKTIPISSLADLTAEADGSYTCYTNNLALVTEEKQLSFVGFDQMPLKRSGTKPSGFAANNTVYNIPYHGKDEGQAESTFKRTTADSYTGGWSLKYNYSGFISTLTSGNVFNAIYIGNGTKMTYGKSYEITFWAKKDSSYTTDANQVNVYFSGGGYLNSANYTNARSASKSLTLTNDWQEVKIQYTPDNTVLSAQGETEADAALSPILYFGDRPYLDKQPKFDFFIDTITVKEIDNTTVTLDYCDGETVEYAYGYEGEEITLPSPKRSEYKFEGWFTENTYKNQVVAPYKVPVNDITLYAKWTKVEEGFWSGDTKKPEGEGEEGNAYKISNAEELAWVVNEVCKAGTGNNSTQGKYFELTQDIYINKVSDPKWKEKAINWYTAGDTFVRFQGILDGKGHTIYGLYVNKVENAEANKAGAYTLAGLFPSIGDGAIIKNLGLDDSYICANAAGGFSGAVKNSSIAAKPKIIGCYIGKGVTVESKGENYFENKNNWFGAGGFIGLATQPVEFRYCYSKATAKAEAHARINENGKRTKFVEDTLAGTFVGFGKTNDKIEYRSCYSAPTDTEIRMLGATDTAAQKSQNTYAISNIYKHNKKTIITYVLSVSDLNMLGEKAKEFMPNLDYEKVWKTVDGDTPILRIFDVNDAYKDLDLTSHNDPFERDVIEGTPGKVWTGGIASKFAGGKGTVDEPYEIATAEQLFYFVDLIMESSWGSGKKTDTTYTTLGKYYKITHDIYLNDISNARWYEKEGNNQWEYAMDHAQCLQGTLDGDGHVVYGLYFNVDVNTRIGLIPSIGQYGVIKNLMLANSYIVNEGNTAAGIVGMSESRTGATLDEETGKRTSGTLRQLPTIENCGVAENVTIISSTSSGGILGFSPTGAHIKNCYSLASLSGEFKRLGGLIAYIPMKENDYTFVDEDGKPTDKVVKAVFENCYVADEDKRFVTGSLGYAGTVDSTNCYTLASAGSYSTVLSFSNMTDEKAKANMKGFDFENVWTTVEKSTPALKIFADRKDLDVSKLVRFKGPVTISFETYGGNELKPIVGESGSKLKLPTPKRDNDVFEGWYVYPYETWDVPFKLDYIPDNDITLYAKWNTKSLRQGFEKYYYSVEDESGMEEDYAHYTTAYAGYDINNVHGGAKSIYRLGAVDEYKNVSVSNDYTVELTKGAQYELSMWVKLMEKPESDDALYISWLQDDDWAFDEDATEKICNLSKIKVGEWQEVKFTFVAYGKHLGLKTPGVEMFIDDVNAIFTGKTGLKSKAKITPLKTVTTVIEDTSFEEDTTEDNTETVKRVKKIIKKKLNNGGLDWWVYGIIVVASVAVLGGGAVVFLLVRKKRRGMVK